MKRFSKFCLSLSLFAFLLSSCARVEPNETETVRQNSHSGINPSKKELISELNNSVFCISIVVKNKSFDEKRFAVGTGFLVGNSSGYLASALHVETKARQLSETLQKGSFEIIAWKTFDAVDYIQFPVELFLSDQANDLAIYRFDPKVLRESPKASLFKPLKLAEKLPPLGEEVLAVGYYGDYQFPFNSIGNVSMIDKNEEIISDITIMPGNSGAPVISLETGEVLGIVISVLELRSETVRFGISKRASKIKELLQKIEKKN